MLPRVSVVITTYNHSRLLPVAVDSALAQTYPAVEVIVVDDGSTDDTPEVMQQYTGRVRYIRQANQGVTAARNAGIRAASGEFINVLDSDDFFLPAKVERQMQVFNTRSDVGLVHCGFYHVDENGNHLNKVTSFPSDNILRELAIECFLLVHAPLVRRGWYERVGFFDEHLPWNGRYCEDWDLWLRMTKAGCQFAYVHEPLIAYRILKSSQMAQAAKMESGAFGVLDRFYAAPDLPVDVVDAKAEAYGLRRLWISFGYYDSGAWGDAKRNLAEAFAVYPTLANDPMLTLQNIVDGALMPRVRDPLAFVDSVLAHLPSEAIALQGYGPYLRSRVLISMALQDYAAGNVMQAQRKVTEAIGIDPSLPDRLNEFRDTLSHYSTSLPSLDPVYFAGQVLGHLPAEAKRLRSARLRILSDVSLACAFTDYEETRWARVIRRVLGAARYRPAVFKNRGVLSILGRSLLSFFKVGIEARRGTCLRR